TWPLTSFGPLAQFEWELVKARTKAGLVAARARGRARGRTGGQPPVMTTAKIRAALRMISAGTLLTVVASVLGVGRTMLYRHLEATSPTAWFCSPTEGGTAVPYNGPVRKTLPDGAHGTRQPVPSS
ncbi:MAG: helix-turn-helix domain-containing protein, partial [Mycobacteriaceae bacterium]